MSSKRLKYRYCLLYDLLLIFVQSIANFKLVKNISAMLTKVKTKIKT